MRAIDLDEAQGLTRELVTEYLTKAGWRFAGRRYVRRTSSDTYVIEEKTLRENLAQMLDFLVDTEKRTPQAVLRYINPRMREGVPSEADRLAHKGLPWLVRDENGNLRTGFWCAAVHAAVEPPWRFYVLGRGYLPVERVAAWSFWRCDADGNKLPWTPREGTSP